MNSVRWCGHMYWREDGHVLRRALDFEIEGQWKNGRLKRIWKKEVDDECAMAGLIRLSALSQSKCGIGVIQVVAGLR